MDKFCRGEWYSVIFSYGDENVVIEVIKTLCCIFFMSGVCSVKNPGLPIESPKNTTGRWKNRNVSSSKKMKRKMRRNQGAIMRVTQQGEIYDGAK
jgi:hypothetical protein